MIPKEHIRSLREELRSAGVFTHRTTRTTLKFLFLAAVTAGLATAAFSLPTWGVFALAPLASVFAIAAGMIGHEACHRSFADSSRANKAMAYVAYPLFSGLGIVHWHEKHNVKHHGHPNVVGQDDDLKLWPMAVTKAEHEKATPFARWFQRRLQGYAFWPLTLFLVANMRFDSRRVLWRELSGGRVTGAWIADAACQIGHLVLWIGLPAIWVGLGQAVLFYVVLWTFAALLLALIFAPAHMGLPLVAEQARGWHHQLATARNVQVPRWVSYFFVGLDYQVEHHLFPRVPHQNLPMARLILRRWCLEHGYPHQEMPFWAAVRDTTTFVANAWQIVPGRL